MRTAARALQSSYTTARILYSPQIVSTLSQISYFEVWVQRSANEVNSAVVGAGQAVGPVRKSAGGDLSTVVVYPNH